MKTIQITRPRLVSKLISFGYMPISTDANPWNPKTTMWTYQITTGTSQVIRSFYEEVGKPVPKSVVEYLESVE